MPLSLLPSLLLSVFAVGYSPGPANIYALSCVLNYGKKRALKMWLGLLCGYSTAAIICCTIFHFIGLALGEYVSYIKYIGACYILYLAYRTFRSASVTENSSNNACSFFSGALVQMTNAKMILYELSIYSSYVLPYSDRLVDLLVVAAILLIAGPGANLVWLLGGNILRPVFSKYAKAVSAIMAISLALCAVLIALA